MKYTGSCHCKNIEFEIDSVQPKFTDFVKDVFFQKILRAFLSILFKPIRLDQIYFKAITHQVFCCKNI